MSLVHDKKDEQKLQKYTMKLEELHDVLQQCIDLHKKKEIERVPATKVKKMYESD